MANLLTLDNQRSGMEQCIICREEQCSDLLVKVTKKGLTTLRDAAEFRCDSELFERLHSYDVIFVHANCRRDYTDKKRLRMHFEGEREGRTNDKCPKRLKSVTEFSWKECCFFCTQFVERDPVKPCRVEYYSVSKSGFRDNILKKCEERNDEWGIKVKERLQGCLCLIAAKAVYHKYCYTVFMTLKKATPVITGNQMAVKGRPENKDMLSTFIEMCDWLETVPINDIYSLEELQNKMKEIKNDSEHVYSTKWLEQKLKERYGEHIFFAEVSGKRNVVCFHNMAAYLINQKWHDERKEDINEEKQRILLAAEKIIAAEIREKKLDTEFYPTPDDIKNVEYGKQWLTPSLQFLMEKLIPSSEIKQVAIGQAILHACRPKLGIPPVLLGVGVEMDHVFGSKWLLNELSRLGFSVSYDEVVKFKHSVVAQHGETYPLPNTFPGTFTQWIADNVDHNVCTLDGKGTFHGMGIISASTAMEPETERTPCVPVRRQPVKISVKDLIADKSITIVPYENIIQLDKVFFKPFIQLQSPYTLSPSVNLHLMWHICGLFTSSRANWSGFMHNLHSSTLSSLSNITFLPIIALNPTDTTCIYSTLRFIEDQAKKLNISTPCVTFDQPLWIKAFQIINKTGMKILCRLGGFHMLMSFLGSIGNLMSGSGLEDALKLIYAENTVPHMLTGKAIARAIRGHYLVESVLLKQLLNKVITNSETDEDGNDQQLLGQLKVLYEHVITENKVLQDLDTRSLTEIEIRIEKYKDELASTSRTAKLWLQYLDYIKTIKLFVHAERIGDWNLHLVAVGRMLNLFAATGHVNYAKSSRLYLENMQEIKNTHPSLYLQFASHGSHVVRRSDSSYWSGLWTDLVIEQTLMRSIKTRGGLTHGRGMTDTVQLTWVHSMHACASVHEAMSTLTKNVHVNSEQHVEMGTSRINRDNNDLLKLSEWFMSHNPFAISDGSLQNLTTGVRSEVGDGINCDSAEELGSKIHLKLDNCDVFKTSIKRADQVKSLSHLQKGVKVDGTILHIDNTVLFCRLISIVERNGDFKDYLKYELTPEPTSLFKDNFMRKPDKASLVTSLLKNLPEQPRCNDRTMFVLDGGALLHKVRWNKTGNYQDVMNLYSQRIDRMYGPNKVIIVFDGYGQPSTKDHEHQRRLIKSVSANINITETMSVCQNQSAFLLNTNNKNLIIQMLMNHLKANGHVTKKASSDADTLIVSEALQLANEGHEVTVVADDTDILIMLLYHMKPNLANIFLEFSNSRQKEVKILNIRVIRQHIGEEIAQNILFIHAMSGCDTTSAIFGHGKASVLKAFTSSSDMKDISMRMSTSNVTQEEVGDCGQKFLVKLFHGSKIDTLTSLRYKSYMRMSATGMPLPNKLPPTERAAYFHSLRVHLQIEAWKMQHLDPLLWGWRLSNDRFVPIMTDVDVAPDDILKVIRCNCKMTSVHPCGSGLCTCKKHGVKCVVACGNCQGEGCENAEDINIDEPDDDFETSIESVM